MNRLGLIVLFLLWPLLAFAQPVAIRSGEHDTFSRLVIGIGEGTDWSVSKTEDGYLLDLNGRDQGFDTSSVFERIPRSRIRDLREPNGNQLLLSSDCDCFVDAFIWQPGQLVLDIVDGSDPNPNTVESADTAPQMVLQAQPDAPLRLPNLLAVRRDGNSQPLPLPLAVPPETGLAEQGDLAETETALLEGLARAASQGFLDAAVTTPQINDDEVAPPEVFLEDVPNPAAPDTLLPQRPGVGIVTALDRDLALIGDLIGEGISQNCMPADLFRVNEWGDGRPFHDQVSSLAEALAGEFGEEPREAQDTLARLYLHFGFGVEARVVLAADQAQSQSRQVLTELAGLIDNYAGDYPTIASQAGCATAGALWSFLNQPLPLEEDERNLILQEFFALPQPLRGQISPRLSARFIEIGDVDAAGKLLRASENNDSDATHEVQAARAALAIEVDDPEQAIDVLAQQAGDNARTTPESLIRLIELEMENGIGPAEADLVLASALRQEFQDLPIAHQLAVTEANGRTYLGQYQQALDILTSLGDGSAPAAVNNAFLHLTQNAKSSVFLGFAYGTLPDDLTPETENAMASRLIDLGFPDRASVLLRGPAQRETASERRYLRAQAAIAMSEYSAALDEMLGLTDPRARELRTQALTGLGEYREALSAAGDGADAADQETLQFRAGAWERLADDEASAVSPFAEAVLTPPTTDPAVSLTDRRALLAQSEESRRAVEGLLQQFNGQAAQANDEGS